MDQTRFWAVKVGRTPGIYTTLEDHQAQVHGSSGALSKRFPSRSAAESFLLQPVSSRKIKSKVGSSKLARRERARPYPSGRIHVDAIPRHGEWVKDYYAVLYGRRPGVYTSWQTAEEEVRGFEGAKYKRFATMAEAIAFLRPPPQITGTINASAINRPDRADPRSSNRKKSKRTGPFRHKLRSQKHTPYPLPPTLFPDSTCPLAVSPALRDEAIDGGFMMTREGALVVYTDGSAKRNGKRGCVSGTGVWWGQTGKAASCNISERVPGHLQTNNRAELLGIIRALEVCPFPDLSLEIRTDSLYSIQCITKFLPIWLRNNFRLITGENVKNQDMIVHILALLNKRGRGNSVLLMHVRGHAGEFGNEAADRLAFMGSRMPALPERRNWYTLLDVHRQVLAVRARTGGGAVGPTLAPTPRTKVREVIDIESDDEWSDVDLGDGMTRDPDDIIVISDSEMSEQEGDDDDDDDDLKRDVWRDDLQDPDDEFGKSDAEFDQIVAYYDESAGRGDAFKMVDAAAQAMTIASEAEIDPSWLMSQEEMAQIEAEL